MSCQDKPLSPNSKNRKQDAGARSGTSHPRITEWMGRSGTYGWMAGFEDILI